MLIEKITQKYKKRSSDETIIKRLMAGDEELFYYYEPAITVKLNQAIDWNYSKVPDGEKKELEEGDTFMFDGRPQVISIVDDGIGENIERYLNEKNLKGGLIFKGKGTAAAQIHCGRNRRQHRRP